MTPSRCCEVDLPPATRESRWLPTAVPTPIGRDSIITPARRLPLVYLRPAGVLCPPACGRRPTRYLVRSARNSIPSFRLAPAALARRPSTLNA